MRREVTIPVMTSNRVNTPQLADLPDDPPPGPGQVRIAVAAVGLNFLDVMLCRGEYPVRPTPPFMPSKVERNWSFSQLTAVVIS